MSTRQTVKAVSRAGGFILGMATLIVTLFAGWVIPLPFSTWVQASYWGAVLSGRALLQLLFSWWNNRGWRGKVRREILEAACFYERSVDRGWYTKHFYLTYPSWRQELWDEYPKLQERWYHVMRRARENIARRQHMRGRMPTVGAEVPIHGVSETEIRETVESLLAQTYPIKVIFLGVNDHRRPQTEAIVRRYVAELASPVVKWFSLPLSHKRAAMAEAFRLIAERKCTLTWNVDADTRPDIDGLAIGVMAMLLDRRVRGITSNVQVGNRGVNNLTRLTYLRYLFSNVVERAAQSAFGKVTCMSGPYMLLYTEDVMDILADPQEWEFQEFLGEIVGPGDDRMLTVDELLRGLRVAFIPDIYVWTDCPSDIRVWQRQQLRWARSAFRAFAVEVVDRRFWAQYSLWSTLDELYLTIFPFVLGGVIVHLVWETVRLTVTRGIGASWHYVLPYLVIVFAANIARAVAAIIVHRDIHHWRVFFYVFYQLRYLVVIRIRAALTPTDSSWLSR